MVEKAHTAGWLPNTYEPMRALQEKMSDWFAPRSEASAGEDAYDIALELPGVDAADIDVTVTENSLIISGEKRTAKEQADRTYYFSEREFGAFQRTFRLPPDADTEAVEASYSDGVLSLRIGKRTARQESGRKISVRTA